MTIFASRCFPRFAGTAVVLAGTATIAVGDQRGSDLPFSEEALPRGLSYTTSEGGASYGHGIAFIDLNNSGHPDVVAVGASSGQVGIFENDDTGHFVDRSGTSGIQLLPGARGICAADYDNDGLLDIFITRKFGTNVLLHNNGDFTFTDVSSQAGVEGDPTHSNKGCSWGDFDGDGHIDLAVAHYGSVNTVYRNQSDGTFVNVTAAVGADTGADNSFQVCFFDFNHDATPDLYVIHDAFNARSALRNRLLKNVDGVFTDVSETSGTDLVMASMCIAVGDMTRNGWPDIFITNLFDGHALLCNQGDEMFERCDADAGVTDISSFGWGSVMFDYNNDGWLDLYTCLIGVNKLYRGGASWPMHDVAAAMGVDANDATYTVAVADVNGNGALDMLVQTRNQPLRLFINNNAGVRNWAKFAVGGEGIQHFGIGARLDLQTVTHWQQRQVLAGSNYLSQDHLIQHFGLNDATVIDELIVTWPGGHARTLSNLSVNQTWTIYPQDKLGDGNFDGHVTFEDFLIFADCYFASITDGSISPGCEMMDFDGDGVVDLEDFDQLVLVYEDELADCNDNGIPDLREILSDSTLDDSGDWTLDDCGSSLPGDLNGDGIVNVQDLLLVISYWGSCGACPPACAGDANNDCQVNVQDLLIVISNWGTTQ